MNEQSETLVVADMDQFIQLLFLWHKDKVQTLEHMLSVPEGIEVRFNDEGPQILSGDLHKGFVMGLSLGLMELGSLPFATEPQGADEEKEQPAASDEPVKH